jgi:methyl-accepting chemotaxis protein
MNTSIEKKDFFKEIHQSADKFISYALAVYFVFGIGISFVYQTYLVGIGVGSVCLAAFFVTKMALPNSHLYRYVLGAVLAVFSAQFIYQMHGMFEMHFFVFVGATLLIAYQNWKLQIPLLLVVVIHHALFAYLQNAGMDQIYFTQGGPMDLFTFITHGGLAAVIVGICGWWAFDLEKRTISEGEKSAKLLSVDIVNANIAFAEEISKGNLNYKAEVKENDQMGLALVKMQQNLLTANQREQDEKYVTMGINTVSEILRSKNDNLKQLCDEIIKGVVKYLGANQGGIFLTDDTLKDNCLHLVACYAYERKKFLEKKIEIGEGLLGQCFLERDTVYLRDVPKNYIRITSGLGDAPPANLLLVPIQTEEQIVGILEIASLQEFGDIKINLAERMCEIIASSVVSTRVTERVSILLKDSQQQAEELRAQEEEVRQNMEELQATQEEIQRKSFETSTYIDSINNTLAQIQFDPDGYIQSANDNFLKAMGYQANEIVGKHHRMFVDAEYADSEEYRSFWPNLKNGKPLQGEFKRFGKGGREVWISATYTPVVDKTGKVARVIKLAQDITSTKQKDIELRAELERNLNESEKLKNVVEKELKVREAVFGYTTILSEADVYGNIKFVNDKLCEVSKYSREELIGKPHNIFRHPDMPKELFKQMWETIKEGNVFKGIIKNRAKDGTHYWVDATIVPIKDENSVVTKYVGARYHITNDDIAEKLFENQLKQMPVS